MGSRGLVAAIDIAMDVLALWPAAAPVCGRLVVLGLSGPPNYGPGALPPPPPPPRRVDDAGDDGDAGASTTASPLPRLPPRTSARDAALTTLRSTGGRLARRGLSLFLACSGSASCDAEALRSLVLPCGGTLALVRTPGNEQARAALSGALSEALGAAGRCGASGCLTVRCSSGLRVDQVIGPATPFDAAKDCSPDGEESADDGACFLGWLDPSTCVSLSLDVRGVDGSYVGGGVGGRGRPALASVQAALRYVGTDGEQRLRTYTLRAPVTPHTQEWLAAVDVEATALLAARLAALSAGAVERDARDPSALAARAAELASGLAELYGAPIEDVARGWLWNSVRTVGYDASAAPLPELLARLHHLGRSPSSLELARDLDAAHAARHLLLTAPPALARRVAAPAGASEREDASMLAARVSEFEDDDAALASAASRLAAISVSGALEGGRRISMPATRELAIGGASNEACEDPSDVLTPASMQTWLDKIGVVVA